MGEMASLWGYAEHHEMDQLGQKLLYTTLELEKLKSETMQEMRRNKEYVNQLIHLLKCAVHERDEAKNQLGKLINKTMSSTQLIQPETSLLKPVKAANSSITESNSLSEVESLFDAVSSPELSNFIATQSFSNDSFINNSDMDQASLIMDSLVKGRDLPENGMFLQAVVEAGPLLQTLLLAGPLPRWRNPPQLQPFQIPPVTISSGDAVAMAQKPVLAGNVGTTQVNYACFGNLVSGNSASLIPSSNACFRLGKRQRFC